MPVGNSGEAKCECWFLDVGQGSANVILLGGGKAIVIDCGPVGAEQTRQLLKAHVNTIEALIITHNDNDHDGHAAAVIEAYPNAIRDIYFLTDRYAEEISLRKTLARLMQNERGEYPLPKRLEADGDAPRILFSENDITLKVIYPNLTANLQAEMSSARRANLTSAILRLSCGERKIVFSSDATIEAWDYIASKVTAEKPLLCDIMTVPHHGGKISVIDEAACQQRLYAKIIRPVYGIVSVGSNNTWGHPLNECISALRQAIVKVLCTQMTPQCCEDIENIRPLRRTISRPARSDRKVNKSSTGRSRHVACFGSVVAEISSETVRISNLTTFEQDMVSFGQVPGFTPICRPLN